MKNFKSILLIAVFTLVTGGVANAQKIGHVNSMRVLANMPETRAATTELQKSAKTHMIDIEEMTIKGKNLFQKYTAEQPKQTEKTNQERTIELQSIELKIKQLQKTAQDTLGEKEAKLMEPIYTKLQNAIDEIAKAKGLLYIFDISKRTLLVSNGTDIYSDLEIKLGLLKDQPLPKK
jgi:outer membrane protein